MPDETRHEDLKAQNDQTLLINDLTVGDARHLIATEGGPLDVSQIVLRGMSTAVVAAACAYAIWAGHANVWHLALPMVSEYLALLIAVPLVYVTVRHEAMRNDAVGSVRLLAILAVAAAIAIGVRSYGLGMPWKGLVAADLHAAWAWIRDHKITWAILAAMAGVLLELPGRLANLKKYGPPFSAVGLGCGMRVAVLFLGAFLLPFVMSASPTRNAWILLALLVIAEVLAILMQLDVQRRLKEFDSR